MAYQFGILTCGLSYSGEKWDKSCSSLGYKSNKIDICTSNWQEKIKKSEDNCFLLRPPGELSYLKQLYDERVYIISEVMQRPVYPSYQESLVYENKRLLNYYLKAKGIPHPETKVFYLQQEAHDFADSTGLPIAAKTNIGASGSGVKIIKKRKDLHKYIKLAFSRGIERRRGPNRKTGSPTKWLVKAIKSPKYFMDKLKQYKKRAKDKQRNFVIFQEFIPHEYEWRAVSIGGSYFAHKKAKIGQMASGTKDKIYDNPPLELLDFVRGIMNKTGFYSQAIDIFEHESKGFLVNEIQTIFGQSDAFQMKVDGKKGRYIYDDGWVFEEGDFNTNESFNLRLKHAIKLLESGQL